MPEGDTVFLAATRLHEALAARPLCKTDFRVPPLATVDLSGRVLHDVVARGKHLLFRIDGGLTLHTHFKMEGSWHLYRPGERWRERTWEARVVLENDAWQAVGFRLGVVELVETTREDEVVGHLGPDPLGSDWDPEEAFRRLIADPERSVGEALLDQTVIAGLGNVYKSEICFLRGIAPSTRVRDVADPPGVVRLAKRLLDANRGTGRQITTGDTRPGRTHWVYGRGGQPCRRCNTPIAREEQDAGRDKRVTYWCPTCQPGG